MKFLIRFPIHYFVRSAILIFTLLALLVMTSLPGAAQQEFTPGLEIKLASDPPKHVKACDTFKVTYAIHNPGLEDAANVNVFINVPDPFELIDVQGVPEHLGPGEKAKVTAVIKVVAFVPGEVRGAWVRASVTSDLDPDASLDPNPDHNEIFTAIRLISKPVISCP